MPHKRKKAIHGTGAVGKVSFEAVENPYTGLFQDNWAALIRYSLAFAPSKEGIVVAAAVKIFRDNVHSANIFVMHGKKPQTSPNFLEHDLSNHIDSKKGGVLGKLINWKSNFASSYSGFTGLSDVATYNVDGSKIEKPIYPFQIIFRPREEGKYEINEVLDQIPLPDKYRALKALRAIYGKVPLWDLYASNSPLGKFVKIGTLYGNSQGSRSDYGDKELFFKHQLFEEDIAPGSFGEKWKETCPKDTSCPSCHISNRCIFE